MTAVFWGTFAATRGVAIFAAILASPNIIMFVFLYYWSFSYWPMFVFMISFANNQTLTFSIEDQFCHQMDSCQQVEFIHHQWTWFPCPLPLGRSLLRYFSDHHYPIFLAINSPSRMQTKCIRNTLRGSFCGHGPSRNWHGIDICHRLPLG